VNKTAAAAQLAKCI